MSPWQLGYRLMTQTELGSPLYQSGLLAPDSSSVQTEVTNPLERFGGSKNSQSPVTAETAALNSSNPAGHARGPGPAGVV